MTIGFDPKKGSVHHRILFSLSKNGQLSSEEIRTIASVPGTVDKLHSGTLSFMRNEGLIEPTVIGTWSITSKGLSLRMSLGDAEIQPFRRTALLRRAEVMSRPNYDGADLRPMCARPGAYDAFKLPSLMGSRRVYRKGVQA